MDNLFFGGCWGRVSQRRSLQTPARPAKSKNNTKVKPKKVVTIAVNFMDSETAKSRKAPAMDQITAAVKIQASFRGFSVRKTRALNKLRVIMKTRAEAAKIRKRVNDEDFVELIRGDDEKERLKITEWIMSLLLRLDEIQGAIPFVRESRKALVLDLLNLQDSVDRIVASKCMQDFKGKELAGGMIEISVSSEKAEASKLFDLQIESSPEEDNYNSFEESFVGGSSETQEYKMVDVVDKDDACVVREEEEKLKRTVSDLLKKTGQQSETICDLNLRISQLEDQVFECTKKKKLGRGGREFLRDIKATGLRRNGFDFFPLKL